jgi:hypothetical protein
MLQFKAEYHNSKIIIKTQSLGKLEINTETADPEKWANVPELAFMFEDVPVQPKKEAKVNIVVVEENQLPTNYKDILALAEEKGYEGKSKKKADLIDFLNSL